MPIGHEQVTSTRIAVVVPCFNDGITLPETLASLEGAGEPLELAVVDDCSDDPATCALLDELAAAGTRVVRVNPNAGLSAARMAGVAATSAPYVFPLDADDLAVPGSLTAMADALDAAPRAAACAGDYEEFGTHAVRRTIPASLDPFRIALVNEYPVTALFRRDALLSVGGWRSVSGPFYEDWDLWMALAEQGRSIVHPGPDVVSYRRRNHGPRMLGDLKQRHREAYGALRSGHPELFARLNEHRRASNLSRRRKLLYPLLYGDRRRYAFEPALRRALDRAQLWQLGR